jgi:hypothetical protein
MQTPLAAAESLQGYVAASLEFDNHDSDRRSEESQCCSLRTEQRANSSLSILSVHISALLFVVTAELKLSRGY